MVQPPCAWTLPPRTLLPFTCVLRMIPGLCHGLGRRGALFVGQPGRQVPTTSSLVSLIHGFRLRLLPGTNSCFHIVWTSSKRVFSISAPLRTLALDPEAQLTSQRLERVRTSLMPQNQETALLFFSEQTWPTTEPWSLCCRRGWRPSGTVVLSDW